MIEIALCILPDFTTISTHESNTFQQHTRFGIFFSVVSFRTFCCTSWYICVLRNYDSVLMGKLVSQTLFCGRKQSNRCSLWYFVVKHQQHWRTNHVCDKNAPQICVICFKNKNKKTGFFASLILILWYSRCRNVRTVIYDIYLMLMVLLHCGWKKHVFIIIYG